MTVIAGNTETKGQLSISWAAIFVGVIGVSMATAEPLLTLASILVLPVFVLLLWRANDLPLLVFVVAHQWISVAMTVFRCDLAGKTVGDVYGNDDISTATWLSLIGLGVLASGISLGVRGQTRVGKLDIYAHASRLSEG